MNKSLFWGILLIGISFIGAIILTINQDKTSIEEIIGENPYFKQECHEQYRLMESDTLIIGEISSYTDTIHDYFDHEYDKKNYDFEGYIFKQGFRYIYEELARYPNREINWQTGLALTTSLEDSCHNTLLYKKDIVTRDNAQEIMCKRYKEAIDIVEDIKYVNSLEINCN